MTSIVGPKGQVVIPKHLRDELGIRPGDEVEWWLDGDHPALRPVGSGRALRGRLKGAPLTADLLEDRAAEVRRESL